MKLKISSLLVIISQLEHVYRIEILSSRIINWEAQSR